MKRMKIYTLCIVLGFVSSIYGLVNGGVGLKRNSAFILNASGAQLPKKIR